MSQYNGIILLLTFLGKDNFVSVHQTIRGPQGGCGQMRLRSSGGPRLDLRLHYGTLLTFAVEWKRDKMKKNQDFVDLPDVEWTNCTVIGAMCCRSSPGECPKVGCHSQRSVHDSGYLSNTSARTSELHIQLHLHVSLMNLMSNYRVQRNQWIFHGHEQFSVCKGHNSAELIVVKLLWSYWPILFHKPLENKSPKFLCTLELLINDFDTTNDMSRNHRIS